MKKSYKNPQVTVKPLNLIIVGLVITIFVALIFLLQPNDQKKIYKAYSSAGSTNLVEDHVFKSITVKDLMKKIDNKEAVVFYFGSTGCSYCVTEIGYYDLEFKNAGLEDSLKYIYYLDATKVSNENITKLQTKYSIELNATPKVYFFNDGAKVFDRASENSGSTPAQIRAFFQKIVVA